MATEIDILNSNVNEQNNYNSINDNQEDLIHNYNDVDNTNINNHVLPNSMSISKSREKRMTKLLIVGLILPLSVLLNIQSSEIPAWYKKVLLKKKKKKKKKIYIYIYIYIMKLFI